MVLHPSEENSGALCIKGFKTCLPCYIYFHLLQFMGQYEVVVNASGFRSRDLVGDKSVYPVRGHLIRVNAPWIKNWVYTDDLAYFIPG